MAALNMVAQTPRRADHNVTAIGQQPLLAPRIHTADARHDHSTSLAIEPGQFAAHLDGQFAGWRNRQRQGRACPAHTLVIAQQGGGRRQTKGHGLARPGLGGNQQVLIESAGFEDGGLNRGRFLITLLLERKLQGGVANGEGHADPDRAQ